MSAEDEPGSVEPGKRADVAVDREPFEIDPHALSEVQVLRTLLDGRDVYAAP